jgi:hypothetical protein
MGELFHFYWMSVECLNPKFPVLREEKGSSSEDNASFSGAENAPPRESELSLYRRTFWRP